jgi:hypothetical protein
MKSLLSANIIAVADAILLALPPIVLMAKKKLRRTNTMKTLWVNELTGINYDDYDEAVENVLEDARYIEEDIIREVLEEHSPHDIISAMANPEKGSCLYDEIMSEVVCRVLSNYLIESEVPDKEYDFIMEDETNENF